MINYSFINRDRTEIVAQLPSPNGAKEAINASAYYPGYKEAPIDIVKGLVEYPQSRQNDSSTDTKGIETILQKLTNIFKNRFSRGYVSSGR